MGHINLPFFLRVDDYLNLGTFFFAYLDPGSGSFILQLIIAGAAGLLYAFRGYWSRLVGLVKKQPTDRKSNKSDTNECD